MNQIVAAPKSSDQAIEQVSQARAMLERCVAVPETLLGHSMAKAGAKFLSSKLLKGREDGKAASVAANEIVQRFERKLGQILKDQRKSKGGQPQQKRNRSTGTKLVPVDETLADQGITKNEASRWQKQAEVPDEKFEAYIGDCHEKKVEPRSSAVRKMAPTKKPTPPKQRAPFEARPHIDKFYDAYNRLLRDVWPEDEPRDEIVRWFEMRLLALKKGIW